MQPVTILELQATISDSPKKKAPGLTGLTNEIWKHLPPLPLQIIVKLFNITMKTGFLPNKVNTGKIILLPKINNWSGELDKLRPITLLETFRKLFTSIITQRLTTTLEKHCILQGPNFGFRQNMS
ncbi:hypothetical protein ROZALSC1DRAFT_1419, partial [Rozella allomycis CSF55]